MNRASSPSLVFEVGDDTVQIRCSTMADGDFHLAVPLLKGQLSCRELIAGEELAKPVFAGEPLTIDHLDNPYSRTAALGDLIRNRGIDLL